MTQGDFDSITSLMEILGIPEPYPKGWVRWIKNGCVEIRPDIAEHDRLEMKKLYQEKSGDYSY